MINKLKRNNTSKYTVVELFAGAGAGGLALGLEQAGFNTEVTVEINKWAVKTLKVNRPKWNVIEGDTQKISQEGIGKYLQSNKEIDLLSGGYPCQSFSYAGNRQGMEDIRGTLFYDFAKILEELKPKMFFAENVKGLVSHDKGQTLKTMIKVFEEVGYVVQYKVLNSVDYSVAQKRQRIIIIGIRKDIREQVGEDFSFPKPHDKKLILKDILQDVPSSACAIYNDKKKAVLKYVKAGGCWRDLPDDVARDYMKSTYFMGGGRTGIARRLSWDEAGLTVLCTPAQKQTERCHPDELRPFSVRENARIQSFPDEWVFEGSMAEQYKQIGNAVPVNLAKEVGLAIKKYLDKLEKSVEKYNLGFISDEDLYIHVKETIEKYSFTMNLKKFNSNLIDPIKLTFDAKVYKKTVEEIVNSEIVRQLDKSNSNVLGYFQQNFFKYIVHRETQKSKWIVPNEGFDIENEEDKIYEIVTGEKEAFKKLVEALPEVMDDVLEDIQQEGIENTVFKELKEVDENILKSLYLLSFQKYEGFNNLSIENMY